MRLVPIPADVPPDLAPAVHTAFTLEMCAANRTFYGIVGHAPPWVAYVAVDGDAAVGVCAFKGAPKENVVEIAYGTHPGLEGRGIATQMTAALIAIARGADPHVRITAQTLPEVNASTRVLSKLGFQRAGEAMDDDVGVVWNWELPRT